MEEVMKRLQHLWVSMVGGGWGRRIRDDYASSFRSQRYYSHRTRRGAPVAEAPVYHYVYYPEAGSVFRPGNACLLVVRRRRMALGTARAVGVSRWATSVNLDVDARDPWRHHTVIVEKFPRTKHEERRERREERREEKREHNND